MIYINCPAGPTLLLHGASSYIDGYGAPSYSRGVTNAAAQPWDRSPVAAAPASRGSTSAQGATLWPAGLAPSRGQQGLEGEVGRPGGGLASPWP